MDAAEFQRAVGATEAQMADLACYRALLEEGNAVMNLVGPATLPDFWRRHAMDSAQLLALAPEARTWADLGTGAGLPGVVLAILLKGREGAKVWLVDSLAKRCRFLRQVVETLDLPAEVIHARAETVAPPAEVVTARACAPLDRLLAFAWPCLKGGALGLFLKGESVEAELKAARRSWKIDADLLPSQSDPRGRVVRLRSLSRAR